MDLADAKSDKAKIDDTKLVPQDTKKRWLRRVAEEKFEKFLRILFFWEKDDKRLGKIIRVVHHFIIYTGIIIK